MRSTSTQLAVITLMLLYCVPLLSQTSTIRGYVRDKKDKTPIDSARVWIVGSSKKPTTTNSDGYYLISGLTGQKVIVVYAADGYGSPTKPDEVTLDKNQIDRPDVYLYKDLRSSVYWDGIIKTFQLNAIGTRPQEQSKSLMDIWTSVDASTLSPEAKSSAAHVLVKSIPSGFLVTQPASLKAYSVTNPDSISRAQEELRKAVDGEVNLQGQVAIVPSDVAADVAAHYIGSKRSGGVSQSFLSDFKTMYGNDAVGVLQNKIALQSQTPQ